MKPADPAPGHAHVGRWCILDCPDAALATQLAAKLDERLASKGVVQVRGLVGTYGREGTPRGARRYRYRQLRLCDTGNEPGPDPADPQSPDTHT